MVYYGALAGFYAYVYGSRWDKPEPLKASSILTLVVYTRKPVSLGDMDWDGHTVMIVHTI